ncbi:MAG: DUF6508 domain-containing protein [Planctomycetes bacterium]|jgi:hypothetical protein|nr:DUF6508 domain-containing protein [Planctomycetota bacterium]
METPLPSRREIEALVAFLPRLHAEGVVPILRWHGGPSADGKPFVVPYPEYHPVVAEFFRAASAECWCDHGYDPRRAGRMLEDPDAVRRASLAEVRSMLTYCVRGERFCDGHQGAMVEGGRIRRLLERIAELAREAAGE